MTKEEAIEIISKVTFYWEMGEQTLTQKEIDEALDMAIKALEQTSDDCISRTEALKHSHIEYDDDGEGHRVIYTEDIEELPSVTPQQTKWIPVSERLPEEDGQYLVLYDFGDGLYDYKVLYYITESNDLWDKGWNRIDDMLNKMVDWSIDMVAWMPLPSIYQGESEE